MLEPAVICAKTRLAGDNPHSDSDFHRLRLARAAATNVLIDSLHRHSSSPLAITPLVTPQLEDQGL